MNITDLEAELVRHHQIIQDWLTGVVPNQTRWLAPFRDAHTDDFNLIDPEGTVWDLTAVIHGMYDAHATDPRLAITIDRVQPIRQSADIVVVTYRETHTSSQGEKARIATAVLTASHDRLAWRHLHETWESGA